MKRRSDLQLRREDFDDNGDLLLAENGEDSSTSPPSTNGAENRPKRAMKVPISRKKLLGENAGGDGGSNEPATRTNPFASVFKKSDSATTTTTTTTTTGSSAFGASVNPPFGAVAASSSGLGGCSSKNNVFGMVGGSAFGVTGAVKSTSGSGFGGSAFGATDAVKSTSGSAFGGVSYGSVFGSDTSKPAFSFGKPNLGSTAAVKSSFDNTATTAGEQAKPSITFGNVTAPSAAFGSIADSAKSTFNDAKDDTKSIFDASTKSTFGDTAKVTFGDSKNNTKSSPGAIGKSIFDDNATPTFGDSSPSVKPFSFGESEASKKSAFGSTSESEKPQEMEKKEAKSGLSFDKFTYAPSIPTNTGNSIFSQMNDTSKPSGSSPAKHATFAELVTAKKIEDTHDSAKSTEKLSSNLPNLVSSKSPAPTLATFGGPSVGWGVAASPSVESVTVPVTVFGRTLAQPSFSDSGLKDRKFQTNDSSTSKSLIMKTKEAPKKVEEFKPSKIAPFTVASPNLISRTTSAESQTNDKSKVNTKEVPAPPPAASGFVFKPISFGHATTPPDTTSKQPDSQKLGNEDRMTEYYKEILSLNVGLYQFLFDRVGSIIEDKNDSLKVPDSKLVFLFTNYEATVQEYIDQVRTLKSKYADVEQDIRSDLSDVTKREEKESTKVKGFSFSGSAPTAFTFGGKPISDIATAPTSQPFSGGFTFDATRKPEEIKADEKSTESKDLLSDAKPSLTNFGGEKAKSTPGFTISSGTSAPPASSGFQVDFGKNKISAPTPSSGNQSGAAGSNLTSTFQFGSANTETPQAASLFQFGSKSQEKSKPASSSFQFAFGNSATTPSGQSSQTQNGQSTNPTFNFPKIQFGGSPATPENTFAFKFGPSSKDDEKPQKFSGGFQFNANAKPFQPTPAAQQTIKAKEEDGDNEDEGAGADEAGLKDERTEEQVSLIKRGAGEEDETTLYEVRCKLYRNEGSYKDLGINFLKINRNAETNITRLLSRQDGTGNVTLNARVTANFKTIISGGAKKDVIFGVPEESTDSEGNTTTKFIQYFVRCKDACIASATKDAIDNAAKACGD